MSRLPLAIALTAIATSLPSAAAGSPAATLQGVVGPGFVISLQNVDGTAVAHLDPGSYTITVDDRSVAHNFHLSGPGVDQFTEVETIGMATWAVTLVDGTYAYHCDAHPSLKGSFTVGTVPAPSPSVPRLSAKVSARAISLKTAKGVRVRGLSQGTYRIAVTDSSKQQNFHLRGPGVNRKTKVGSTGTTTWTVALRQGTYIYRSDKSTKLRGAFTVKGPPPVY